MSHSTKPPFWSAAKQRMLPLGVAKSSQTGPLPQACRSRSGVVSGAVTVVPADGWEAGGWVLPPGDVAVVFRLDEYTSLTSIGWLSLLPAGTTAMTAAQMTATGSPLMPVAAGRPAPPRSRTGGPGSTSIGEAAPP